MIATYACAKGITNIFNANQKWDSMDGQVIAFSGQKNIGVVAAGDGPLRLFHINDWRSMLPPQLGMTVNFMVDEDGRARQVQVEVQTGPATNAAAPAQQPTDQNTYTAE